MVLWKWTDFFFFFFLISFFLSFFPRIELTPKLIPTMLTHIIHQKFEHRFSSNDIFDDVIRFLSGEQVLSSSLFSSFLFSLSFFQMSLMEISYTKQQQKQKQKQKNKNQDSDTMETFKEVSSLSCKLSFVF